jgi:hypothetical protein
MRTIVVVWSFGMGLEIFSAAETGDRKSIEDFLSDNGDLDLCDEVFMLSTTVVTRTSLGSHYFTTQSVSREMRLPSY